MATGKRTKAVVLGAGIGGLTSAIALRRAGFEVAVYERAKELKPRGAGLGIQPNAMKALQEIDLDQAVIETGQRLLKMEVFLENGRYVNSLPVDEVGRRFGAPCINLSRPKLQQTLLRELGEDVVMLDSTCEGFTQDEQGVTVRFQDGREVKGDVLIGADGINSVVRAQLHGSHPPSSGHCVSHVAVPKRRYELPQGLNRYHWGRGAVFGYHDIGAGSVYWWATTTIPQVGVTSGPAGKARLRAVFHGWPEPIPSLIDITADDEIAPFEECDRAPLERWGESRVTLLGDAAHPMISFLAQGAGMAIEDSVSLRRHLRGCSDHHALVQALRAYERERIPRTARIVRESRENLTFMMGTTWLRQLNRNIGGRLLTQQMLRRRLQSIFAG
ncbi:MAG TPA: FAD-dependent monooxygenase [Polyangiaceae bacterium]|jgi:2-polyprenyl-6-methoxyphenol hydroxylase-like FAD-dependent oxidoreductase|nr:FAD-dependent monooxygenase [Polyangiaceae bacterium]